MKQKKKTGGNKWNGLRRLMGVKKGIFEKIVRVVMREEKKRRQIRVAKRKLSIEKMVRMMLEYYRQYWTYYQIDIETAESALDCDLT